MTGGVAARLLRRAEAIADNLAGGLLFLLMMITLLDVTGRNIFGRPLAGATELSQILLPAVVFLLCPSVAYRGLHIAVDLIDPFSGPRLRAFQHVLGCICSAALFGIVARYEWMLAGRAMSYGDVTPMLGIPIGLVLYGIAALAFLTAFVTFLMIFAKKPFLSSGSEGVSA